MVEDAVSVKWLVAMTILMMATQSPLRMLLKVFKSLTQVVSQGAKNYLPTILINFKSLFV